MTNVLPNTFKGIALFTPGGDLIYGIDRTKQTQWHSDLCIGMQRIWGLVEPPHFLVPGYTATVERWFNSQTQQIETIAEVHYPIERYIPLLQVLFDVEMTTKWHIAPWQEEHCNRAIIETYRAKFPQLWSKQELIVRLDPLSPNMLARSGENLSQNANPVSTVLDSNSSYVLHLFIKSDRPSTEKTLSNIHQLLEEGLDLPYTLKVIDIDKNPQQAASDRIIVFPTLVRVSPQPIRRIVGQLDDIERILNIITSF